MSTHENDCVDLADRQTEEVSLCVPTSPNARAKRRIAALMDEIEILKQDKAMKQRYVRS